MAEHDHAAEDNGRSDSASGAHRGETCAYRGEQIGSIDGCCASEPKYVHACEHQETHGLCLMEGSTGGAELRIRDQQGAIITHNVTACEWCPHNTARGRPLTLRERLRHETEKQRQQKIDEDAIRILSFRGGVMAGDVGDRPFPDVQILHVKARGAPPNVVRNTIAKHRPHVICNHAWTMSPGTVRAVAPFVDVPIVTICHSSQNHLLHVRDWLSTQQHFLELAKERSNCWYAIPDDADALRELTGCERIVAWPNWYAAHIKSGGKPLAERPVISLAGRRDMVKAFPSQILGAALAAQQRQLRVVLSIRDGAEDLERYGAALGLDISVRPWSDKESFRLWLRNEVHVGLQVSMTESWNYVALDHLAAGVPVVGSPAIRYLPRAWQANPASASSIARVLLATLDDYQARASQCQPLAAMLVQREQAAMRQLIDRLVSARPA